MDIDTVLDKLGKHPCVKVHRGAPPDEVLHAARQLNTKFPESYKKFLLRFGWAELHGQVLYGLGRGAMDTSPNNVVRVADFESCSAIPQMRSKLIPLMNDGAGNHDCLDTRKLVKGECPVVEWDHEHPRGEMQAPRKVSANFTAWLARKLRELPD